MPNPNTAALSRAGVSIWLDDLSRAALQDGSLARLIAEKNVVGVTTNPAIFANAIGQGLGYEAAITEAKSLGLNASETVLRLASFDVADACDLLQPIYEKTGGCDGRVSIEVEPQFAHDRDATVKQAQELWQSIARPNLMIKVPATEAGLLAFADLTAAGISVNVTLIFSVSRYREVLNAYMTGLERALDNGIDLASIHSVASVFISRLDTAIASLIPADSELQGAVGIANARAIYQVFTEATQQGRWDALMAAGANPQRPLWASTGVKDKALSSTLYVDELIAANTVTTLPAPTLEAFADNGTVSGDTITPNCEHAQNVLDNLSAVGIDYAQITAALETDGLNKFEVAWNELLETVEQRIQR